LQSSFELLAIGESLVCFQYCHTELADDSVDVVQSGVRLVVAEVDDAGSK